MTPSSANGHAPQRVSLKDLDEDFERLARFTEHERSALWLFAWASRDAAARVAELLA